MENSDEAKIYGNIIIEMLETDQSEKLSSLDLPPWFAPISAALIFNKGSAKGTMSDEVRQKLIDALLETAIKEEILSAKEEKKQGLNPHSAIANALAYIPGGTQALRKKLAQTDLPPEQIEKLRAIRR